MGYRFPLSYRDVEEMLLARGIDVTHEAIRQWCLKFGQDYANRLKRRRAQPGDKWHLDEVFLTINVTGCEFSGDPKLLPFALVEAQSERRVRGPQKNAWHVGKARTTKCA